jgi:hypothetical protein
VKRRQTLQFRTALEAKPVRIVGDAAIATAPLSEGRLVPLLIVDALERPDITELIRMHAALQPGDVSCQWGKRDGQRDTITLFLEFERPVVLAMMLDFDIESQGVLVDLILRSRAFYLQAGKIGDRLLTTQDQPRLLVEAANTGFEPEWEKIFLKHIAKALRRRGVSRSRGNEAAADFLARWRRFSGMRMRG